MTEWLSSIFGETTGLVIAVIGALSIVLILIWFFVKFGNVVKKRALGRHTEARINVVEAAAVDTRRRLVLIRRDQTEHLIMIGGPNDLIIEREINKNAETFRQNAMDHDTDVTHMTVTPTVPADRLRQQSSPTPQEQHRSSDQSTQTPIPKI